MPRPILPPRPRFVLLGGDWAGQACTLVRHDSARDLYRVTLDRYPGLEVTCGPSALAPIEVA